MTSLERPKGVRSKSDSKEVQDLKGINEFETSNGAIIYYSKPIGKGAFSVVYKGYNVNTDKVVAVKKIKINKLDKNIIQRILDEIDLMSQLAHENIIKYIDFIRDYSTGWYIVLEYCETDLATLLNNEKFSEKRAQKYTKQLASALKYLNNLGIIHRDIKPHNILITKNDVLKLADFGFAKKFVESNLPENEKLKQTICGSPLYMAPEVFDADYNFKADLWSIGILIYEMIYGQNPFKRAKSIQELLELSKNHDIIFSNHLEISDECLDLMKRLLEKDKLKRMDWEEFFSHVWITTQNLEKSDIELEEVFASDLKKSVENIHPISNAIKISKKVDDYLIDNYLPPISKSEPIMPVSPIIRIEKKTLSRHAYLLMGKK